MIRIGATFVDESLFETFRVSAEQDPKNKDSYKFIITAQYKGLTETKTFEINTINSLKSFLKQLNNLAFSTDGIELLLEELGIDSNTVLK